VAIVLAIVAGAVVLKQDAADALHRHLTHVRHVPEGAIASNDVVYVLGGTPDSLRAKFRVAATLVREGKAARVLVLSQDGPIGTKVDQGRNLTANEWAAENLVALGIAPSSIEFVKVEEGFFGTWSEATAVARLVRERRYQRLLLVTAPFHSRRVWESFRRTIQQPDSSLYLYVSSEPAYLRHLFREYLKLLLYRALLF